jgi:Zn-dependent protease
MLFQDPMILIPFIPVLLLALTLHEFGHAWTALYFGDPTAKLAGRVTLDPLKHLDPMGTIFMLIAQFGWAKPVPVNPANFTHPRADLWVSLAGIIANLIQAVLYALLFHAALNVAPHWLGTGLDSFLGRFLVLGVLVNLSLALFNLLPIFPLDGSHVLKNLLPWPQVRRFTEWSDRYGALVLFGLLMIGSVSNFSPLSVLIGVPRNWLARILFNGI